MSGSCSGLWTTAHSSIGFALRPGKEALRPQAVRLRWSDQTRVSQESQDHEEGCVETGVRELQGEDPASTEAMQALRARVWHPSIARLMDEILIIHLCCSGDKKTKGAALVF